MNIEISGFEPILIEHFLQQVERKAYKMALMATKSEADALDIVQNAMMKLVESYRHKSSEEWKPLFYRILQNQIKNWYRRERLTSKLFFWQKSAYDEDDEDEIINTVSGDVSPELKLQESQLSARLLIELEKLPVKQQQCFLLRSWEGLSVKETAKAMACTEGTIKTHMSRASQKLWACINEEADEYAR